MQTGQFALLLPGARASHLCIRIKLTALAGFACLTWSRQSGRHPTLYLPVASAPVVTVCGTKDDGIFEERLAGFKSHPLLSALSQSFVVAIDLEIPAADMGESLRQLLAEPRFLPVPVFDTRIVHVSDASCWQPDRTRLIEEPLCSHRADEVVLHNLHWAVGMLCSASTALQAEAMKDVVTTCCKIAEQHESTNRDDDNAEAAEAALYTAMEASLESYWADVSSAFSAAYGTLKTLRGEQINRLRGVTDRENYVLMKRVACTPSRMILLPPTPMKLG